MAGPGKVRCAAAFRYVVAGAGCRPPRAATGEKTSAGSAVQGEVILEMFDVVFGLAARTINVFVQRAGIESRQ